MTQQQISLLLDIPDRTLRDWKNNRNKLYSLLESLDYADAKEKINGIDINDIVIFNPKEYSYNQFWQTSKNSEQKVYYIISNYLSTMQSNDIKQLCKNFGKTLVKSVLNDKYKKMYKKGYISTGVMDIPLTGIYNKNETYKEILRMINDC